MSERHHSKSTFETVIKSQLLGNGYALIVCEGFDRQRAIFRQAVLAFIEES